MQLMILFHVTVLSLMLGWHLLERWKGKSGIENQASKSSEGWKGPMVDVSTINNYSKQLRGAVRSGRLAT